MSEPPPLEDFTEVLQLRREARNAGVERSRCDDVTDEDGFQPVSNSVACDTPSEATPVQTVKPTEKKKKDSGMRKGFLTAAPKTKSKTSKKGTSDSKTTDALPMISAKAETNKEDPLRFKEVQDALKSSQKEWLNDDLLKSLSQNQAILQGMANPRLQKALEEFQSNPREAAAKYQNDNEVMDYMRAFMGAMGQQFEKLGAQQDVAKQAATADDDVEEIPRTPVSRNDPRVEATLRDTQVQRVLHEARINPMVLERAIDDPQMREKLQLLVAAGVLELQRPA
eukprot:Rmarinus@m.19846